MSAGPLLPAGAVKDAEGPIVLASFRLITYEGVASAASGRSCTLDVKNRENPPVPGQV